MRDRLTRLAKRYLPALVNLGRDMRGALQAWSYRVTHGRKAFFECPLCGYSGPFQDYQAFGRVIEHTRCPRCDTYERHRLQWLVFQDLASRHPFSTMSMLHFAPELQLSRLLRRSFLLHHTADLIEEGVDHRVDMRALPFPDASYDVVLASHVLEHIPEDMKAISEVRRILKPTGFAVLPVPVVSPETIEYPEPNPREFGHVRAPGLDYFDRYRSVFSRIDVWDSNRFDDIFQLYTYEDRSRYPAPDCPLRLPMKGTRHLDYVPVCYP